MKHPTDLINGEWTYLDLKVNEGDTVSYKVVVKDASGTVIYQSPETTL